MSALGTGVAAGRDEWKTGPTPSELEARQRHCMELWNLSRGTLFADAIRGNPYRSDPRVYKNIGLMWNHTARLVDFYGTMLYQGHISQEAGKGSVPILPDKDLSPEQVANLMAVINAINKRWNYQQQLPARPKMTAMMGASLTEMIDDTEKRFIFQRLVWPGYVKHIELDNSGFIDTYALEYWLRDEKGNP